MATYDWSLGTGGTMRIVDTGTYVEFWLNSNNSTTFAHELPWGYTVNGVTDNSNTYDYTAGAGWRRVGRWLVTTDQTVTFRIFDTGTGRFGSGESHSVAVDRASAPPAPTIVTLTPGLNTVAVNMDSNGTGGLTVDQWQLGYGTSSTTTQQYMNLSLTNGTGTVTGLNPNTTYYFWARGHNAKGWGPWSPRKSTKTLNTPPAPSAPVISNIKQSSVHAKSTTNGDGGSRATRWRIGYGKDPATPTNWIYSLDTDISGLSTGDKYYFWAQVENAYGWGPYSARSEALLLAGAYVDVAGVKKRAVPYVKVAGEWKVAEMRVNIKGLWTGTG